MKKIRNTKYKIQKRGLALLALISYFAFSPSYLAYAAFDDELGAGARAPGMGDAFTAVADDVYAVHYNPAGLGTLAAPQFTSSYSKLFMGLTDDSNLGMSFMGYAQPLKNGRLGGLGVAAQQTKLSGLYDEQTLSLSYGTQFWRGSSLGKWYGGTSLKSLSRSIGAQPESGNALDGLLSTGQPDSVLTRRTKRSALDLDVGFLYQSRARYSLGVDLVHVNRPDVAFSPQDRDRLPLGLKLGGGYKSLWMNLSSDLTLRRGPTGALDKRFTLAGERWFQSLHRGELGLRSSLGLGSREFKQITMGFSYRLNKFQLDYAFLMPLDTVASAGTHRFALTLHFGAPTPEEEYGAALLKKIQESVLPAGPDYRTGVEGIGQEEKKLVIQNLLDKTQGLIREGKFEEASLRMRTAFEMNREDRKLHDDLARLHFIGQKVPEIRHFQEDAVLFLLYDGILHYLVGKDREAVDKVSHALSLVPRESPTAMVVQSFLGALERKTGLQRGVAESTALETDRKLGDALAAAREKDYPKALRLSEEILEADPNHLNALKLAAEILYARKNYEKALSFWTRAVSLETNVESRKQIEEKILESKRKMKRPAVSPTVTPVEVIEEAPAQAAPAEVEALYEQGVADYARGDLEKAASVFRQVLKLDPSHEGARKALERIESEKRRKTGQP